MPKKSYFIPCTLIWACTFIRDTRVYFYSIIDFSGNLRFDTDVAASHHFRLHSLNILNTPVQFLFLLRVFYQLCVILFIFLYTFFCNGTSWVSVSNFWSISWSWVSSDGSDIFLKYWGCEKIWTKYLWVK